MFLFLRTLMLTAGVIAASHCTDPSARNETAARHAQPDVPYHHGESK